MSETETETETETKLEFVPQKSQKTKMSKANKQIYGDENDSRRFRRMIKDPNKFYFGYQQLEGSSPPHDYRLQLKKIIFSLYRGKKISEIPSEFELVLKLSKCKFLIFFENKETANQSKLFSLLKFEWLKGLDEQEYGIFDD